ncbi:MAG: LPP20 family lipoprotein [Spirochaetia bacterium]|nr:LPP20 family lipoprotein [Spirochaetia bacterium]
MKNIFYLIISLCLLLVCSNCFAELPPEWIDNPSAVYDKDSYITAVGTGKDRKAAEASAINALASIFGQSVSAETKSSKNLAESHGAQGQNYQGRTSISQDISLHTDIKSLINAEIKLTWSAPDGTCYALALIDKYDAANYYSREIAKLHDDIVDLTAATEGESPLSSCMNHKSALSLAEKQNEYMSILTVLNSADAMLVEDKIVSPNKVKKALSQLQQKVPIHISIAGTTGDWNNKIQKVFAGKLQGYGFRTTPKESRYELMCNIEMYEYKLPGNPNQMVKYTLNAVLMDNEEALELSPYYAEGQTGFQTLEGAVDRAYMLLEKKLKAEYTLTE